MKNGEIYHLWENFGDLYRYRCRIALQNRTCTGTGQSCTGTGSAMFFYFDQRSYFGHNLLISYPI